MSMLTSCVHELCYDHYRTVEVGLTWEYEWERDYGMNHFGTWDAEFHGFNYDYLRPERPEWVNLIRFSDNQAQYEHFLTAEGGDVIVDAGDGQSFLLYNGDTEYIILSDVASAPNARASATGRSRASLSVIKGVHADARTTNPPDVIYSAFVENVPSVELHERKPLAIKMQPLVYTYVVRYEFEHGLEHVALARGALGGMAESVYLRNGTTSDNTSIVLYDCEIKPYGCEAHVRSFGVPGFPDSYYGQRVAKSRPNEFMLNLEVCLKNGKNIEFDFDISDQIVNQPRGGVIKVSGIRIEDEESTYDSGFSVGIDNWGEREDIDLPVGVSDYILLYNLNNSINEKIN